MGAKAKESLVGEPSGLRGSWWHGCPRRALGVKGKWGGGQEIDLQHLLVLFLQCWQREREEVGWLCPRDAV